MAKREMVEAHVDSLLKRITGNPEITRDSDGDWPFVLQRSVMYVRVMGDGDPTVSVWGVGATSVPASPELFKLVNDLNNSLRFCRALWSDGGVLFATELVGESLDIEELDTAMKRVASAADVLGPKVVEACGGETPRKEVEPEEPAPKPDGSGMYL